MKFWTAGKILRALPFRSFQEKLAEYSDTKMDDFNVFLLINGVFKVSYVYIW